MPVQGFMVSGLREKDSKTEGPENNTLYRIPYTAYIWPRKNGHNRGIKLIMAQPNIFDQPTLLSESKS